MVQERSMFLKRFTSRGVKISLLLVMAFFVFTAQAQAIATDLLITGVIDGPLPGGLPKAVELYVVNDIADLSIYGLGSANNGDGSDGEEFTFPADSATVGDFIYVATEGTEFANWFGFAPDYTNGTAPNINGDDAIELFENGSVIDVFGDINTDGTGEPWEHLDGWAYRVNNTEAGGSTFTLADWTFSGINALDGESTNATAATPFPVGSFTMGPGDVAPAVSSTVPADLDTDVAVDADITVLFSEDVAVTASWFDITCSVSGAHTAVSSGGPASYTLNPDADFANSETCTVTVFATEVTDVDTDDPPDNLDSDYSFSFDTESGAPPAASDLIITGLIDGPLPGGLPKAIEVYVANDVADLSIYGLGAANNGGGTDGEEFTFPADSATAGDFLYVATEAVEFANWFGFAPDYTDGTAPNINGDDAVELFQNGAVVDVFGDIDTDGTGQPWEHLDGWAYRVDGTGPDGSTFVLANWTFSGPNALDGESDNATAATPFPAGSYAPPAPPLILTAVFDGPLPGGLPKGIELYVGQDIADLSIYGFGSANNGGGTDGEEFTFPADSATAGDYIYVATESVEFANWFGFAPDYTDGSAPNINGDDAIELFENGVVIDIFGDIDVDGTGQPWEHLDGWAYRVDGTGPDGSTFVLANWTFSGPNALDGESDNATAATPVPVGTYTFAGGGDTAPTVSSTVPSAGAFGVALNADVDITFSEAVTVSGSWFDISCTSSGAHTAVATGGPTTFTLNPDVDFDSGETCTVTVFASEVADQDGTADNMANDFSFSFDTAVVEACGEPFTPIYDIQGSGLASTLDGNVVSTEGIVTATFNGAGEIGGFFIQDAAGDGDAATSDGIYVFTTFFTDPVVGDKVRVNGEVDEFFDLTEITNVNSVIVCGAETPIAATNVTLPLASVEDMEAYEGMYVTFSQELSVTDTFNTHRFGEVVVSADGRQINLTNEFAPGAIGEDNNGNSIQDANEPGRLVIDDASSAQFPTTIPYFAPDNTLRLGDTVTDLTGVMSYGFDVYRLQPTDTVEFVRSNPRPTSPTDYGADVTVASMNMLNYFAEIDNGSNDARGADSIAEFERQEDKLVAAILEVDADVVGLQEIQNDGTTSISALVDALNDATAPGTWAYVVDPIYNGDPNGLQATNAIKVGIIYQTASVTPVGASVADEDSAFSEDRPPVAQTFDANGELFTVIVNHFKSKGCGGSSGLNADQNDGQGCYNERRTEMAVALLDFVATMQSISGDDDVVVLGDMNAYAEEDPILALEAGLINQVDAFVATEDKYSFTFFGQSGQLDHMFTTASLDASVVGTEIYHINTDEPRVLSYNDEVIDPSEGSSNFEQDYVYAPDQYRASDHDPVILSLKFEEPGPPTNEDGCYVLALYGSPFTGEATMVDYYSGNFFYAHIWEAENSIPAGSCYEIHGTDATERIYGNGGNDVFFGYGGNDALVGRNGDDTFTGGFGNDSIYGGNGFDSVLDYAPGADRCRQVEDGC